MRSSLVAALVAVAGLGSACGGSNPGSGSETLHVSAEMRSDGSPDGTWVSVVVREGQADGPVVSDASVTLDGDSADEFPISQAWSIGGAGPGWYLRNNFDWDTGFTLKVRRGSDWVEAYIQTPGYTAITQPIFDTTFLLSEGRPLVVKWTDSENRRAEGVTIRLSDAGFTHLIQNGDPLEFPIEPTSLTVTDSETVTVERRNDMNLAGGTAGSVFTAATEHHIPFRVQ